MTTRRVAGVAGLVLAAALLMGAKGCGSTSKAATSQTVAPATTTAAATATTAATVPPTTAPAVITLKVLGAGNANDITILDGGNESQHNGVPLPYTTTLSDHPADVGITAQAGSDQTTATIGCEIDIPGKVPVVNQSSGAYAVVDCTATPGL